MNTTKKESPYIVAEIGSNHNGDLELAKRLIEAAKRCGCDCVKFQSWDLDLWASEVYEKDEFLSDGRELSESLKSVASRYAMSREKLASLREHSRKVGIDFASSGFTAKQIADLSDLESAFVKVASMDLTSDYLLKEAGRTGLPIVLATGLGSMAEVAHAVEIIEETGNRNITLLHCLSLYPPPDELVNLRNIPMLREAFGYPVGFSDHTDGTAIPLGAVAMGAVLIEKHFTLDKKMEGWDHAISADPVEMSTICRDTRRLARALGVSRRVVSEKEIAQRSAFRRSIVARRNIRAGERIQLDDLDYKRPGTGLPPNAAKDIVGMTVLRDVPADALIQRRDFECGPVSSSSKT